MVTLTATIVWGNCAGHHGIILCFVVPDLHGWILCSGFVHKISISGSTDVFPLSVPLTPLAVTTDGIRLGRIALRGTRGRRRFEDLGFPGSVTIL